MIGLTNWLRVKRDRTAPTAAAPSPILGFADLFGPIGAATRAAPSDLNLDDSPCAATEIPAEISATAPIAPAIMANIVAEPIRLVIWDLDETFWSGTLTEGGITWREDHAEIVRTLAARGIVSAICSKNDPQRIHPILAEHEMAGFFPFASIDWSAKGPRLAALVEAVQLRAPTILFIDDNPLNRAEAAHCVPGLQIRDATSLAGMLDDALLRGKPDPEMKRLAQYQLLAQRQAHQAQAAGDTTAFLRDSAITVRIEYDVGAHLDRAIELINRTNQLNFTKSRLSEDEAEARTALRALLGKHTVQAGLVHVRDRYGDYGFCGIYVSIKSVTTPRPVLLHFAFSCRILGMGIETWLYQHLKRPTLTVKGDVLTDVIADSRAIDWIGLELPGATTASASTSSTFAYVLGRGGCDIRALLHYFEAVSGRVIEETNRQFNGIQVLSNSSLMAAYALRGASAELIRDAATLGFQPENFTSLITAPPAEQPAIWILNFIVELGVPMLRHKATGLLLPISLPRRQVPVGEILTADPAKTGIEPATLARLQQDFTAAGFLPDAIFAENMRLILAQAPPDVKIFIPLGNERHFRSDGVEIILHQMRDRNKIIAQTAASFSNVHLLAPWDFMSEAEIAALETPHHYDRVVYFRMFQRILALCEA